MASQMNLLIPSFMSIFANIAFSKSDNIRTFVGVGVERGMYGDGDVSSTVSRRKGKLPKSTSFGVGWGVGVDLYIEPCYALSIFRTKRYQN